MKLNIFLCITTAVCSICAGCSEKDYVHKYGAIGYDIAVDGLSKTKGTPIDTEEQFYNDFGVLVAQGASEKYSWTKVNNNGSRWVPAARREWTGDELDFYALAPYTCSNATRGDVTLTADKKATFTYEVASEVPATSQDDVMFGWYSGTGTEEGLAPLTFYHTLSAIRIVTNDTWRMVINSVRFVNVYSQGTCNINCTGSSPIVSWSSAGSPVTYSQTISKEVSKDEDVTSDQQTFMVVPQTLASGAKLVVNITEGGVTKDYEVTLSGSWTPGKLYTYSINNDYFKIVYHNNYAEATTDIYEESVNTKGRDVDIILHEPFRVPLLETTDTYNFLGWAETATATEAIYNKNASSGLLQQIDLYASVTNLYAVWEKVLYPWIDFRNFNYPANTHGAQFDHLDDVKFNEYVIMTMTHGAGDFEKINFAINNLIPGKWYSLNFSEEFTDHENPWNKDCVYACTIRPAQILETTRGTMITLMPKEVNYTRDNTVFNWVNDSNPGQEYVPSSNQEICFKATSSTMYWIWDFSRINDKESKQFTFTANQLQEIPVPDTPCINFLESTLHGFNFSKGLGEATDGASNPNGYSTFKSRADYTGMTIYLYGQGGIHEKVNIPLNNLEIGHTYRLSFTRDRLIYGGTISTEACYVGYSIRENPISEPNLLKNKFNYGAGELHNTKNSADHFEDSVEFTATQETMYWVLDYAGYTDDKRNKLEFSNCSLLDITPTE